MVLYKSTHHGIVIEYCFSWHCISTVSIGRYESAVFTYCKRVLFYGTMRLGERERRGRETEGERRERNRERKREREKVERRGRETEEGREV